MFYNFAKYSIFSFAQASICSAKSRSGIFMISAASSVSHPNKELIFCARWDNEVPSHEIRTTWLRSSRSSAIFLKAKWSLDIIIKNKKLQRPSFERRCKITATNCHVKAASLGKVKIIWFSMSPNFCRKNLLPFGMHSTNIVDIVFRHTIYGFGVQKEDLFWHPRTPCRSAGRSM